MDLWIRSQKGEILVRGLIVKLCEPLRKEHGYDIYSPIEQTSYSLGNYKTKERALEVLNEIHQRILDLHVGRNFDCVYQMPEK